MARYDMNCAKRSLPIWRSRKVVKQKSMPYVPGKTNFLSEYYLVLGVQLLHRATYIYCKRKEIKQCKHKSEVIKLSSLYHTCVRFNQPVSIIEQKKLLMFLNSAHSLPWFENFLRATKLTTLVATFHRQIVITHKQIIKHRQQRDKKNKNSSKEWNQKFHYPTDIMVLLLSKEIYRNTL